MLRTNIIFLIFASTFLIFFNKNVNAKEEQFLCSKSQNINARNGPSIKFAIIYKIAKKGYPLKVIEKVDHWFAVQDFKQDKMWISSSNLTSKCGKIIKMNHKAEVKMKPDLNSQTILFLEQGFVINKIHCYQTWCSVKVSNKKGWILKSDLWN